MYCVYRRQRAAAPRPDVREASQSHTAMPFYLMARSVGRYCDNTSVEYVGRALDDAGRVALARMATRAFVDNGELELEQDRDVPMIDGTVSPHEGLTQTQETQVFEPKETEEGEIDVNLEGRDTRVEKGG